MSKNKAFVSKVEQSPYLTLLESHSISPNFWCSNEYFEKGSGSVFAYDGWYGVVMDGGLIAPPVRYDVGIEPPCGGFPLPIWSDLKGFDPEGWQKEFLDHEIIYDPRNFMDLSGKNFSAFRKNVKKWPREHPNCTYRALSHKYDKQAEEVFLEWLDGRNEEIHDDEIMYKYIVDGFHRRGLFTEDGTLVAVNCWDENYKYINFRYSVCRQESFLSEYARYRFYIDPFVLGRGKLVNDGGTLGKESLLFFKKRLNPVTIRGVNSWRKINVE